MTRLLKALPYLLACAALTALPLAAQPDCSFTFNFTGASTQTAVSNLSQNTPCVNWRLTLSTTGTLSATVTFYTSPDNITWTAVPNTVCSSTVQPPCVLQGANPIVGTQGMLYSAAYGSYVQVVVTLPSGAGTGTVRGYGAKGATAGALPGGSGGAGTVTNVATGCGLSGGAITVSGTIIESWLLDPQNGAGAFAIPSADCGKVISRNQAGAVSDTIAQAGGTFPSGWHLFYQCMGAGGCTITPATSTINTVASLVLAAGQGVLIVSDGANYTTQGTTGGTPGGANGQLQYNNSGTLGGVGSPLQPNLATTGATVTSLPTSGWTIVNGAILNDFSIGMTSVSTPSNSVGPMWRFIDRPISVPYTLIALVSLPTIAIGVTTQTGGIYLTDGTKLEAIEIIASALNDVRLRIQTMNTTSSDNATVTGPTGNTVGQTFAVKIVNNSTTRAWSYWSNGAWVVFLSEPSGTWLTESAAGPGALSTGNGITNQVNLLYWRVL
jgi:hypothetical protein